MMCQYDLGFVSFIHKKGLQSVLLFFFLVKVVVCKSKKTFIQ